MLPAIHGSYLQQYSIQQSFQQTIANFIANLIHIISVLLFLLQFFVVIILHFLSWFIFPTGELLLRYFDVYIRGSLGPEITFHQEGSRSEDCIICNHKLLFFNWLCVIYLHIILDLYDPLSLRVFPLETVVDIFSSL